jgi:hypothetical protein
MTVVADGEGLTSRAGTALLSAVADRVGLTRGLNGALSGLRQRRGGHQPGRVVRDLAVMLADGGDCVSDLGALRDQPALFGSVASDSTAFRVLDRIGEPELEAIRVARAAARAVAWRLGAAPERIVLDIDGTLVDAHSDKEHAEPTWKRGYGFHPMLGFVAASREAPAALLRPGNAGSNTAADKVCVLAECLRQLPAEVLAAATAENAAEERRIVARTDSAGATHAFLSTCRELGVRFSVGLPIDEPLREAILALPDEAWQPALAAAGRRVADDKPERSWVTELDGDLAAGWPEGSRLICRKERPHPGAQLSFTDADGHRFQLVLTDRPHADIAWLERDHRARGDAENRVRAAKDCGLTNLPFRAYALNEVWLELVGLALDLMAWTQALCLHGKLKTAEPKALRYRLLHVAGRITRSGRRQTLHLPRRWRWRQALIDAWARLDALPAP